MRKVSILAVSLSVLGSVAACGGGDDNQPPKTPATPVATAATPATTETAAKPVEPAAPKLTPAQAMQKTMGEYGTAMMAKDAKKLASLYAEDAKMITAGMPDVVGRAAIQTHMEHEFGMLKDGKSNASRIWIKNDVSIVEWSMAGVPQGEMMGMKGNEKPIGVTGISIIWYNADGSIKEEHGYMDMGTIMSQMGVTKQKVRAVPTIGTNTPTIIASTGTDEETKNVEVAKTTWSAFDKGAKGEADFVAPMADDIQWDDMTQPETMKGKEADKKFFKAMTTAFPDLKSNVTSAWGIADYVIVEGALNGTQNGTFFGTAPTKKPVSMHSVNVLQMKNGKVVHGWTFANSGETMQQLGQMPKKPESKDGAKDAPKTPATPATPAKK